VIVDDTGTRNPYNEIPRITDRNATALAASLNGPGVDGLVLVIGWDALEPAMGQYQWAVLDQWMSRAVSSGKKVDLSVSAGINTPSWLFQPAPGGAGATPLSFSAARKNGQKGVCEAETIAAPWDPAFLAQWDALLAARSAHLRSVGTYSAVILLRLTGINRDTDELHLPAETAQSTGLACVSDAITTWQQAGYRPSLLLQGWDKITSSFQKSFHDKTLQLPDAGRSGSARDNPGRTNPGNPDRVSDQRVFWIFRAGRSMWRNGQQPDAVHCRDLPGDA
jgi:hypothetical protein